MEMKPAAAVPATDEVIDVLADIELQRRDKEKEAGHAASCSLALHRLHELLDHEKKALQLRGRDAGHPGNVDAVMFEIERVKGLSVVASRGPTPTTPYRGPRKASWRNAQRSPARNKGRRTMGRAGGR